MRDFFCISVTFHDSRFHGQSDGGAPEWPPSPLRLFQAIVAACAARTSIEESRSALQWLERQSAPTIIAPAFSQPGPYRIAVPNNDLDVPARYWAKGQDAPKYKNPQDLKSLKTVSPTHFDGGDMLHYLYQLPDSSPAEVSTHIGALTLAIPSITHLGWGIDMVAARAGVVSEDFAARLLGRRWKPVENSNTQLRVPRINVLDALIERHDAFLHRISDAGYEPVPPLGGFDVVAYADTEQINHRPFAAFDLVPINPEDRRARKSFRQEDAVRVAAMLRHCACEAARNDPGDWRNEKWAEQFVAGHGPHESAESFARFSYLPLPSIATPGQPHADGLIRRAIVAETCDGDGKSAAWAGRRLAGLCLVRQENGAEAAGLKAVHAPLGDAVFRAYCGSGDRWQTITPIVLPGFDDNDRGKRDKLLLRCFEQVGVPLESIADFEVQKSPWVSASAPTGAYKRPDRLSHLPACHLRVYFKRAVAGPLAVGAGRHRGLGLLARMD